MAKSRKQGEPAPENPEKLLDASCARALPDVLARLRDDLIREAARLSSGNLVTEDELYCAYSKFSRSQAQGNSVAEAQLVVSRALRENRMVEWGSYGMAFVLFVFGLVLLSLGVVQGDVGIRTGALLSGSVAELLILLPFRFAINSRRHNIALRMVGYVLSFAQHDGKLAAALLKDTFVAVVLGGPPVSANKRTR